MFIMNSVEEYIRRWTKSEGEEFGILSEWIKSIQNYWKPVFAVFKNPDVINELHRLHKHIVLVPADKASTKIVFVCKGYYYIDVF
jgi:hypothetical protein